MPRAGNHCGRAPVSGLVHATKGESQLSLPCCLPVKQGKGCCPKGEARRAEGGPLSQRESAGLIINLRASAFICGSNSLLLVKVRTQGRDGGFRRKSKQAVQGRVRGGLSIRRDGSRVGRLSPSRPGMRFMAGKIGETGHRRMKPA